MCSISISFDNILTTVGTKQSRPATLASIVAVDPVSVHLHARPAVVSHVDGVGTTALHQKDVQKRIEPFHPWCGKGGNGGNRNRNSKNREGCGLPGVCHQCRCLGCRAAVVHAARLPWVECQSGEGRGWKVAGLDDVVEAGNIALARAGTDDTRLVVLFVVFSLSTRSV